MLVFTATYTAMDLHMAMPRDGHLTQLFHIFECLKKYHNAEIFFGSSELVVNESKF